MPTAQTRPTLRSPGVIFSSGKPYLECWMPAQVRAEAAMVTHSRNSPPHTASHWSLVNRAGAFMSMGIMAVRPSRIRATGTAMRVGKRRSKRSISSLS